MKAVLSPEGEVRFGPIYYRIHVEGFFIEKLDKLRVLDLIAWSKDDQYFAFLMLPNYVDSIPEVYLCVYRCENGRELIREKLNTALISDLRFKENFVEVDIKESGSIVTRSIEFTLGI